MIKDLIYFNSPIFLQNLMISLYGYSLKKKRYSGCDQLMIEINACKEKSKPAIRDLQNELFLKIIRHCFNNIPFYRRKFSDYGITLKDIKDIIDIKKLPILEKNEIQKNPNDFIAKNFNEGVYWINNTSGSTGTPLKIHLDKYTYEMYMALLINYEQSLGINFGDRRATFAGRMIQRVDNNCPPFWRYNKAENQMLFSSYHLTKDSINHYLEKVEDFNPVEIIGYPSSIYNFVTLAKNERNVKMHHLKAVITNSETLFEWQREAIEGYFNVKVFDYYGTAENVVFAEQCHKKRYHPNPLLGFVEIDDNEGKQVGDVIATSFTNHVMPLIRYRIGDTMKLLNEECECGSNYQGIDSILGRNDDNIITRDGKIIGRIDHIFKGLIGIHECQLIQKSYDDFLLNLVPDHQFNEETKQKLISSLKERVGYDVSVNVELVKRIERTSRGKFKGVVNLMKKDVDI